MPTNFQIKIAEKHAKWLADGEKPCPGPCDSVKPLSEFGKYVNRPLGLTSRCKACTALAQAEYNKKYKQTDKGKAALSAAKKRYKQSDAGKAAAKVANSLRRAAEKAQTPLWTSSKALCKVAVQCPEGYHIDHIWPLKHGGLNCPQNLCFLPASINQQKSDKLPTDPEIVALMKAHAIYPILGDK